MNPFNGQVKVKIDRDKQIATVRSQSGEYITTVDTSGFPQSKGWTEALVVGVVRKMAEAYDMGVHRGIDVKSRQIRQTLGFYEDPPAPEYNA